jgi:hypothetical protein
MFSSKPGTLAGMKLFIRFVLFAAGTLLPFGIAVAAGGLVPCDGPDCDICSIVSLGHNVLNFLVLASLLLATIMFAYAGIEMLIHSDNPGQIAQARSMLINVMIGMVILLAAWLMVDTVMKVMFTDKAFAGLPGAGKPWQDILCSYRSNTPLNATGGDTGTGTTAPPPATTIGGTCSPTPVGVCSPFSLSQAFGGANTQASTICEAESQGIPSYESKTDRLGCSATDPNHCDQSNPVFSVGLFQVNMTQHDLTSDACTAHNGGQPLKCTSAFNGKNYTATIADQTLYNACVQALKDQSCNVQTAQQIYSTTKNTNGSLGSWSQWSTASKCNLP